MSEPEKSAGYSDSSASRESLVNGVYVGNLEETSRAENANYIYELLFVCCKKTIIYLLLLLLIINVL